MGPLGKLLRAAVEGGKDIKKMERRVGEEFFQAAEENPEMFTRGRAYDLSPGGLERQFGVQFGPRRWSSDNNYYDVAVDVPGAAGAAFMTHFPKSDVAETWRLMSHPLGNTPPFEPDWVPVEFNTYNFRSPKGAHGEGSGRAGYAAMFGSLLDNPRKVNFSAALSGDNQYRRNFNQAAAVMRDPRLTRQVLVDPLQLKHRKGLRVEDFYRSSPEEQVGALQTEGALQTMARLNRLYNSPDLFAESRAPLARLFDLISYADEGDDPASFAALAKSLRTSGADPAIYRPIGASALKRAALVSDIAGGGAPRRGLFTGLEYRQGGPVRR